jgi:hypothetical protein
MRRERRKLTRREWGVVTSSRPVVRRIPPREDHVHGDEPRDPEALVEVGPDVNPEFTSVTDVMTVAASPQKPLSPSPNVPASPTRTPVPSSNNTSWTPDHLQGGQGHRTGAEPRNRGEDMHGS